MILDPKFLTKEVLGQMFNPEHVKFYKDGIVKHSDLPQVWKAFKDRKDFSEISLKLFSLMRKFEVCFTLAGDEGKPFQEQRSLIPGLLPERIGADPNDPIEKAKRDAMWKVICSFISFHFLSFPFFFCQTSKKKKKKIELELAQRSSL